MDNNIKIYNNLFSILDIEYFISEIKNKEFDSTIFKPKYGGQTNYYNRYTISDFSKYKTYLENILFKIYNQKYFLQKTGAWINKINSNTNNNDEFHLDSSDLTIVTYLNDDFIGGEFEYINDNNENIQIKPQKNTSLIMNNKLLHRVKPTTMGERLSLVCFFNFDTKTKKTIL
jgi:hypothetical protein